MSYMKYIALLVMSLHGPPHLFKNAGVVVDILIGIHNEIKCLLFVNRNCKHKGVLGVPRGKNL
jgi:hypothetical protein